MSDRGAPACAPTVCVIGAGYVGLPLCIMLASHGHRVLAVDVQQCVVDGINQGESPFEEAALATALKQPAVRANLSAASRPEPADIFVIAVPTPVDRRKRVADLSHVQAALTALLPVARRGNLIIVESTIPPLTCRETITPLLEQWGFVVGVDLLLAHCPERILPGDIMHEIVHNDRVIGGVTPASTEAARALYATFVTGTLLAADDVTAEFCKLMENTYRDVNIALANEFAAVSETLGIDVVRAIALANRHPRVDILKPGIGTGGHCIPIDPWFIRQVDPDNAQLIDTARRVNDAVPCRIAAKIRALVAGIASPRLAVVGVTYKPDSADCRESPALRIVELLCQDGYDLTVCDPLAAGYAWPEGGLREVARNMDCLVILVEHRVVRSELAECAAELRALMRNHLVARFYPDTGERPAPRHEPRASQSMGRASCPP